MNPFKFVTAPAVGTRIDHTLQWLTESPLALPGKYVVSLIVSHYSDRLLARIIHEGFYCTRRYAATTSLTAGGLVAQSVTILFQVCLLPSRLRAPVSHGVSAVSSRILVNNVGLSVRFSTDE